MKKHISILVVAAMLALSVPLSACSAPSQAQSELLQPIVAEEGFCTITNSIGTATCYYAVAIENPNSDYIYLSTFLTVVATAYDSNHNIIDTEKEYLGYIFPGEQTWTVGEFFDVSTEPASVEFIIDPVDKEYAQNISTASYEALPASLSDVLQNGENIVGNVTNNYEEDATLSVVVVFRDGSGKVLGGERAFFDTVPAGASRPFSRDVKNSDLATDNFACYASMH